MDSRKGRIDKDITCNVVCSVCPNRLFCMYLVKIQYIIAILHPYSLLNEFFAKKISLLKNFLAYLRMANQKCALLLESVDGKLYMVLGIVYFIHVDC